MIEGRASRPISLVWALLCMAVSLLVAIAANETFLPGKGKIVFLGIFVTVFVGKSIVEMASRGFVILFLSAVAFVHALMVVIGPNDSSYPGGLMFPIGILDIGMCYLAFRWAQKLIKPNR